jgi:hypothetical protein
MAGFDLQSYRDRFSEASRALFGRTYSFQTLEKNFAPLMRESSWLTIGHIMTLYDPTQTPYARYWPRPDAKQLDLTLKKERVSLVSLAGSEWDVAPRVLRVLHNLGLASLVLRFTYPERFAVFNASVASLLQVQRPGTLDLYMAFCKELSEWQRHFRMANVAETEMALWAFFHLSSMTDQNGDAAGARQTFDADIWIQRRRLSQALGPFLRKYGPLELARLLVEENPKLAGKLAGEEHERLLRCAARQFYPHFNARQKGWAETLLNLLAQDNRISLEEKIMLRKVWNARNQAVHPEGKLDASEVENMIDAIERICCRWEKERCREAHRSTPSGE